MKSTLISLLLFLTAFAAFAENCPSIKELQSDKSHKWRAYDSDNDKPLPPLREAKLRKAIAEFVMAEWSQSTNKNMIHCYYHNAHGSPMEAYFAKESAMPAKSSKYWYQVSGMMQCAASAEQCQFQNLPDMTTQLASKES